MDDDKLIVVDEDEEALLKKLRERTRMRFVMMFAFLVIFLLFTVAIRFGVDDGSTPVNPRDIDYLTENRIPNRENWYFCHFAENMTNLGIKVVRYALLALVCLLFSRKRRLIYWIYVIMGTILATMFLVAFVNLFMNPNYYQKWCFMN